LFVDFTKVKRSRPLLIGEYWSILQDAMSVNFAQILNIDQTKHKRQYLFQF